LEQEQVTQLREVSPQFQDAKIARGDLTPEHGKIKPVGNTPGHCSLWLRAQFLERPEELFHLIDQ
jgi:hypothetical protein